MTRAAIHALAVMLTIAIPAFGEWKTVTDGVDYQRFRREGEDIHVVRIDLSRSDLKVVATREEERGATVSEFARRNKAIVAINADYFTKELQPIGLALSPCGVWRGTKDTRREGLVAIGDGRAEIHPQREVLEQPEAWMTSVVSGWPVVVRDCKPLASASLPGSASFTRAPHPRTAVGLSEDGRTMYWVVADGRREGVPGLTLGRLARFMNYELGVCEAINLDGGGSSAIWVDDEIVNRPSDGSERRVANHLAIVRAEDVKPCELEGAKATIHFKSGTTDAHGRKPDVKPQP